MSDITYERLQGNIVEEAVNGARLTVTFKCPVTEKIHQGSAVIGAATGRRAGTDILQVAKTGLRTTVGGVLGRSAGSAQPAAYDDAARQAAAAEAFRTVAQHFAWSDEHKAYIDAETAEVALSEFDLQLRDHPITGEWEQNVAARMLAEIATADGKVDDQERAFFAAVLGEEAALEDLLKQGELSRFEMQEVKPDARASMMMLAYAMAMTDEILEANEQQLLAHFAKGLGVSAEREEQLRHWAACKIVEATLDGCYADGVIDDAERKRITQLAQNVGVNEGLVAKIDVNLRLRSGPKPPASDPGP